MKAESIELTLELLIAYDACKSGIDYAIQHNQVGRSIVDVLDYLRDNNSDSDTESYYEWIDCLINQLHTVINMINQFNDSNLMPYLEVHIPGTEGEFELYMVSVDIYGLHADDSVTVQWDTDSSLDENLEILLDACYHDAMEKREPA